MILRRLYVYIVSLVSLGVLTAGLALLGATLVLFWLHDASADDNRSALAGYTAMVVVALPVWLLHQWLANRRPSLEQRASALRRLYLYLAALALAISAGVMLRFFLGLLLAPVLSQAPFDRVHTVQAAQAAVILAAFWAYHIRLADRDRAAYRETDFSPTLRRWYWYGLLAVSLLTWLSAVHDSIHQNWLRALGQRPSADIDPAGIALAWLLVWGYHAWRASRPPIAADDRRSTLRAVQGFLVLAVCVVQAVVAANLILYYGFARLLGVSSPGGVSSPLEGLSDTLPTLLLYGGAWVLMRRRLARDAGTEEADHQSGVRRLYQNLAALVAMAALAIGIGGVLGSLSEQAVAPLLGVPTPEWRDPISFFLTLLVVGLAVWLYHWRPAPPPPDRQSLSRRLYLYAALLAGVLAMLGSGIGLIYSVFRLAFSRHPVLNDPLNLNFGRFTAVLLVAAAVVFYHFSALRRDGAARPQEVAAAPAAAAPSATIPPTVLRVEVVGATEDDVRKALDGLPGGATYSIAATLPVETGTSPAGH